MFLCSRPVFRAHATCSSASARSPHLHARNLLLCPWSYVSKQDIAIRRSSRLSLLSCHAANNRHLNPLLIYASDPLECQPTANHSSQRLKYSSTAKHSAGQGSRRTFQLNGSNGKETVQTSRNHLQQSGEKQHSMNEPAATVADAQSRSKQAMNIFHKGVAISVWQNSSDEASQWTAFMKRKKYFGQKHLVSAFMESNDFWNKYEDDIRLVKALGCNSFRFSFEWARIEPAPGHIDSAAIGRYHKILDCIEAAGLVPNVTLHHFTHPQWFEARGGFTQEQNNTAFVNYSTLVFQEFAHRISFWTTFNEPSCFGLCGYIMGLWAPGKRGRIIQAGRVLSNMLKAHVAVYRKLKSMPHGNTTQIGIVHQHIRFIPHCNWLSSLIVRPVCYWMTYWFAEKQMLDFFTTGKFSWKAPLFGTVIQFEDPAAVGAIDWWGINYYSRPAINSTFKLVGISDDEPVTGMGMPLVAVDLYTYLMKAHNVLKVPIVVSETGVSDERHVLRARCINTYYTEVLRALADGCDVRGVYYWTLMDNIEWHHGFNQHFGLYEWRPNPGRPTDGSSLQLRQGSKTLVELHNAWPDQWAEMKSFAEHHFGHTAGPSVRQATSANLAANHAASAVEGNGAPHSSRSSAAIGQLPGAQVERVKSLERDVLAADEGMQSEKMEAQQPLLRGGGRITDAV